MKRVSRLAVIAAIVFFPVITGSTFAASSVAGAWVTPTCVVHSNQSQVETGLGAQQSSISDIIIVECKPVFSEQTVEILTPQLNNACHGTLSWFSPTATGGNAPGTGTGETFTVTLDNDGNATAAVWGGPSCAASKDLIEANLDTAPFTTATTTFTILPPRTTPPGVKATPSSEVEDSNTSSVATVFYAEFPSVFAERTVEFSDSQLSARCSGGVTWVGADEVVLGTGKTVTTTLDNNGNAFVVALAGPSCASGSTLVTADLVGPPFTTYTTTFTVLSPRVTV